MTTRVGIYPGTFDPITLGHLDIIKRALSLVDTLIIAVADDIPKDPTFDLEARAQMVRDDVATLAEKGRVQVMSFQGLLMDFAAKNEASVIIRGLRAVSDFEYEFQLASMNSRLNPDIPTVFLPASEQHHFVAASLVKQIARLGGDISSFVSENAAKKLKGHFS